MGNVFLKHVNQQVLNYAKAGAILTALDKKEHPNLNKSVVSSFYSIKQSIVQ